MELWYFLYAEQAGNFEILRSAPQDTFMTQEHQNHFNHAWPAAAIIVTTALI
jgi:hypothetical protein